MSKRVGAPKKPTKPKRESDTSTETTPRFRTPRAAAEDNARRIKQRTAASRRTASRTGMRPAETKQYNNNSIALQETKTRTRPKRPRTDRDLKMTETRDVTRTVKKTTPRQTDQNFDRFGQNQSKGPENRALYDQKTYTNNRGRGTKPPTCAACQTVATPFVKRQYKTLRFQFCTRCVEFYDMVGFYFSRITRIQEEYDPQIFAAAGLLPQYRRGWVRLMNEVPESFCKLFCEAVCIHLNRQRVATAGGIDHDEDVDEDHEEEDSEDVDEDQHSDKDDKENIIAGNREIQENWDIDRYFTAAQPLTYGQVSRDVRAKHANLQARSSFASSPPQTAAAAASSASQTPTAPPHPPPTAASKIITKRPLYSDSKLNDSLLIKDPASCTICGCEPGLYSVTQKQCTHGFCAPCLKLSFKRILDEGKFPARCDGCNATRVTSTTTITTTKPDVKTIEVSNDRISVDTPGMLAQRGVLEPDMILRFEQQQVRSGLSTNENEKWVACPKCGGINTVEKDMRPESFRRRCACGTVFCASCLAFPFHMSMTCAQHEATKHGRDSKTAQLLAEQTKACPKCRTPIVHYRGHGCHHMSPGGCKGKLENGRPCGHHFCYVCLNEFPNCGCVYKGSSFCRPHMESVTVGGFAIQSVEVVCGCPRCPDCKIGKRCADCNDDSCWCQQQSVYKEALPVTQSNRSYHNAHKPKQPATPRSAEARPTRQHAQPPPQTPMRHAVRHAHALARATVAVMPYNSPANNSDDDDDNSRHYIEPRPPAQQQQQQQGCCILS